jgi:hypothetical protein
MERLDTFSMLPQEVAVYGHLHHWVEMFAGRHYVTVDCPIDLRAEAAAFAAAENEKSNRSGLAAYRAGLLP